MRVISGHLGWVRAVAVEPGNKWFATGAGDRVVKVRLFAREVAMAAWELMRRLLRVDLGSCEWRVEVVADGTYLDGARVGRFKSASLPVFVR